MTIEIEIDPNVRVEGGLTFSGFDDVLAGGPLEVGRDVLVRELEADLVGEGRIARIDESRRLVYLTVDWASIRPAASSPFATTGDGVFTLRAPGAVNYAPKHVLAALVGVAQGHQPWGAQVQPEPSQSDFALR